ncbi:regulator of chromosome condensation 1/beta-lactamase-inhibitor protein II [Mrakia frigida]|uniref:SCF ubiquitin ligase complex subunit SAF1 n=1 Tax=Mrakia frigida TaxID=29902 RepID=UPI003FCBF28F
MNLDSLPDEVILDNLLPFLDISSLLSLSQTNVHLAKVTGDNTFWRRKTKEDYNLPPSVSARSSGFKQLYSALRRPSTYVWGASSNGRLGIPHNHPAFSTFHANFEGINLPVLLPLPDTVGLVDLQASGYGFVGLDTQGRVWCWGTLDGSQFTTRSNPNWLHSGAMCDHPRELLLPGVKFESIDCGRRHVLMLDEHGVVWELTAWGKAIKYDRGARLVGTTDAIIQVSAGWSHSSSLSSSGQIEIWWTDFRQPFTSALPPPPASPKPNAIPVQINTSTPDEANFFVLDPIPSEEKIVKIASGSSFLVALTESGKVWTAWVGGRVEDIGEMVRGSSRKVWEEHPKFSLPPPSSTSSSSSNSKITHISAHFETFFAYAPGSSSDDFATSVVLKGKQDQLRSEESDATGAEPEVIPELQGKGVIKVAVGDYHFGALTAKGKLLTWGGYSSGALGLGRTRDVSRPSEVHFGNEDETEDASKKFCFAVAASGWHTGALLVDLNASPSPSPPLPTSIQTQSHTSSLIFPSSSTSTLNPPPSGRPIPGVSNVPMETHDGTPTSNLNASSLRFEVAAGGEIQQPQRTFQQQQPSLPMGTGLGGGGAGAGVLRGGWRGRVGLAGAGMGRGGRWGAGDGDGAGRAEEGREEEGRE